MILKYIVPGATTLLVIYFLSNRKFETSTQWVLSGVISFVTIAILELGADIRGVPWIESGLVVAAVLCDLCFGFGYTKLIRSEWWKSCVAQNFGVITRKGTISYFIDWENGSNVRIVLKTMDEQILGHIKTVGDGDGDGMISVSEPVVFNNDGEELYSREGENIHMIIPIADIKYIEIIN